jgi:serralysin
MGGAFADEIYGGEGADRLIGGSGNDTIVGGGGVDTLLGWDGDDVFEAGEGDSIEGGDGADRILWAGGSGVISGGPGSDAVIAGGDLRGVSLTSVEALEALAPLRLLASQITGFGSLRGAIDVTVSGRGDLTGRVSGAVTLRGESGADTLIGASGDDLILGGDGADSLTGAAGADTLVGGAGVDVLVGGAGADVFVFAGDLGVGEDRITDFATGDRIDLSGLSGGVSHGEWLSTAGADLRIDLGGGASVLVLQATAASVLAGILW